MADSIGPTAIGPTALREAIVEQPALTLAFYTYGLILRKNDEGIVREYPVSPEAVATAISAKVSFSTGLILPNTVAILSEGAQRTVIEYRPPQKTPLWLEGSDDPVRVPLPGLLMVRTTTADQHPGYRIHAVSERPTSPEALLYRAPLPNISHDGSVCWGTVTKVGRHSLAGNDLHEDWAQLLGTRFGNHSVSGKTKTLSDDIRKFYLALEKRNARVFPKRELIPSGLALHRILGAPGADGRGPLGPELLHGIGDDDFEDEMDEDEFDDEIGGPLGIEGPRREEEFG